MTDPQHRLFLECAWEALENAGYDAQQFGGSIAVYAGSSMNTYLLHNLQAHGDLLRSEAGLQMIIGNDNGGTPGGWLPGRGRRPAGRGRGGRWPLAGIVTGAAQPPRPAGGSLFPATTRGPSASGGSVARAAALCTRVSRSPPSVPPARSSTSGRWAADWRRGSGREAVAVGGQQAGSGAEGGGRGGRCRQLPDEANGHHAQPAGGAAAGQPGGGLPTTWAAPAARARSSRPARRPTSTPAATAVGRVARASTAPSRGSTSRSLVKVLPKSTSSAAGPPAAGARCPETRGRSQAADASAAPPAGGRAPGPPGRETGCRVRARGRAGGGDAVPGLDVAAHLVQGHPGQAEAFQGAPPGAVVDAVDDRGRGAPWCRSPGWRRRRRAPARRWAPGSSARPRRCSGAPGWPGR